MTTPQEQPEEPTPDWEKEFDRKWQDRNPDELKSFIKKAIAEAVEKEYDSGGR